MAILWVVGGMALLCAVYLSPYAVRLIQEKRLHAQCGRSRLLVLTYDDGPGIKTTPQLLDVLAEHEAKATFFLLGKCAQVAPELLQRMHDEGHELASHSQAHLNAWKVFPWKSVRDVQQGFRTLSRCGIRAKLFRPPYGKITFLTWLVAVGNGMRLGWWTVVSRDTCQALPDPATIVQAVESNQGGIVLLHDFDGSDDRSSYTVDLTRRLLTAARHQGWKVCTQGELLGIH